MANEIHFAARGLVGSTLYFTVLNSSGQYYNGSTFENANSANWATYDIALSDAQSLGEWLGTFPVVAAGTYDTRFYLQAGGTPATTDVQVGQGTMDWTGTREQSQGKTLPDNAAAGATGGVAIVGSAMTLAADAVNSTSLATSAVTEIAAGIDIDEAAIASIVVSALSVIDATIASPVISDATIDIVQNADYYTADGRDLEWSFPTSGIGVGGATATLAIASGTVQSVTGTVTESSGTGSGSFNVLFQIPRATGDLLDAGTGKFDVFLTLANGHQVPLIAEGRATIRRRLSV